MQFAVASPVRRETRNCSGLLHFLEFFDQIDHAVEVADALGHDQILAVDHVSRNTLNLGHVVGGLPFGAQSLDGFVVFRLVEFVKADARCVRQRLQERGFTGRPAFALLVISLIDGVLGLLKECGLVVLTDDKVRFTAPESSEFESTDEVLAYWQELEGERVKRRHRVRAQLQAKNREINAPKTISTDPELDRRLMQEALRMAQLAYDNDEVPVGAVIAMDGNIVATAMNEVVTRHDPTAHAEVLVIRKAAALLGNERLNGATLYVTLEPCPMCAAACSLARLARVVWGADDPDCGGMRGAIDVAAKAHLNHRPEMTPGVRRAECEKILQDFFKAKRKKTQA